MLAKPKKISRKKVKEDKLVTFYHKSLKFYEEFQKKIVIALGVVAAVIAIIILYSNKTEQDNITATNQLSRVVPIFESGSYQEAIDGRPGTNIIGLAAIVDDFSSTEQGELAKVYLAHSNFFLGNFERALEFYKDYSGSDLMFKATALAGAASCYEALNDRETAAKYFRNASKVSSANAANHEYLLKAGMNYIEAGMKEEAKEVLELLKTDYSSSSSAQKADRYLALIK